MLKVLVSITTHTDHSKTFKNMHAHASVKCILTIRWTVGFIVRTRCTMFMHLTQRCQSNTIISILISSRKIILSRALKMTLKLTAAPTQQRNNLIGINNKISCAGTMTINISRDNSPKKNVQNKQQHHMLRTQMVSNSWMASKNMKDVS